MISHLLPVFRVLWLIKNVVFRSFEGWKKDEINRIKLQVAHAKLSDQIIVNVLVSFDVVKQNIQQLIDLLKHCINYLVAYSSSWYVYEFTTFLIISDL